MAQLPEWAGERLSTDEQAAEVGFKEGKTLRDCGGLPKDLAAQIELLELPFPDDRGRRNPFNAAWRLGFEVGYLGEDFAKLDRIKAGLRSAKS